MLAWKHKQITYQKEGKMAEKKAYDHECGDTLGAIGITEKEADEAATIFRTGLLELLKKETLKNSEVIEYCEQFLENPDISLRAKALVIKELVVRAFKGAMDNPLMALMEALASAGHKRGRDDMIDSGEGFNGGQIGRC